MTVIAEYRLPPDELAVGRAVSDGVTVELERVVENSPAAVGHFWFSGADPDRVERTLAGDPVVDGASVTDDAVEADRYRGVCRLDEEALLYRLIDSGGDVLEGTGDGDGWDLLVSFPDVDRLSDFQGAVADAHTSDLVSVYDPQEADVPDTDLTERQRETLATAYREGYFDIPRKVTLVDLAARLDVSDQAVSERLRRGEAKLVQEYLYDG